MTSGAKTSIFQACSYNFLYIFSVHRIDSFHRISAANTGNGGGASSSGRTDEQDSFVMQPPKNGHGFCQVCDEKAS